MNRLAQSKRKVRNRRGKEIKYASLIASLNKPVTIMLVSFHEAWWIQGESYLD